MKTALVLGGGGSKGAYEIGVWKALRELQVTIDLVCGTSIGAMIGAMIVQDQFDELLDVWLRIRAEDIIVNGVDLIYDLEYLWKQKKKYHTIFKDYWNQKGMDISPFEQLIHKMIDFERFQHSRMDFACLSVNVSRKRPHIFYKKHIQNAQDLYHALMASAACFPAFPMHKLNQERYVDGGYYDNVPIFLAKQANATSIIAVDLKSIGRKQMHKPQAAITYIEPYVSLGSFLCFEQRQIQRNLQLGYFDCMKKYNRYIGYIYTFPATEQIHVRRFETLCKAFLKSYAISMKGSNYDSIYEKIFSYRMVTSLKAYANYNFPYLRVLEMAAFLFQIEDLQPYTWNDFISQIKEKIQTLKKGIVKEGLFHKESLNAKDVPMQELVLYLYHLFQQDKQQALKVCSLTFKETFFIAAILYVACDIFPRK